MQTVISKLFPYWRPNSISLTTLGNANSIHSIIQSQQTLQYNQSTQSRPKPATNKRTYLLTYLITCKHQHYRQTDVAANKL